MYVQRPQITPPGQSNKRHRGDVHGSGAQGRERAQCWWVVQWIRRIDVGEDVDLLLHNFKTHLEQIFNAVLFGLLESAIVWTIGEWDLKRVENGGHSATEVPSQWGENHFYLKFPQQIQASGGTTFYSGSWPYDEQPIRQALVCIKCGTFSGLC